MGDRKKGYLWEGENRHVLIIESLFFFFKPEYKTSQASGADCVTLMDTFTGKKSRKLRISSPATCDALPRQPTQFALLSQKSFLKAVIQHFIHSAWCQSFLFKVTLNLILIFYSINHSSLLKEMCGIHIQGNIRFAFQR